MTTNAKNNGAKYYVIPVSKPLLNRDGRPATTIVQTPPLEEVGIPTEELWPPKKESRVRRIWKGAKRAWKGNIGLLLVAASQAFFSLMNVSVKKLNSIDPPVSALQVRAVVRSRILGGILTYIFAKLVFVRMVGTPGLSSSTIL
jgi:hypothetical protein